MSTHPFFLKLDRPGPDGFLLPGDLRGKCKTASYAALEIYKVVRIDLCI